MATAPNTIKLRFGGGVEPAYSKLTIETPDGKVLAFYPTKDWTVDQALKVMKSAAG